MPKRYAGSDIELKQIDAYLKLMRSADTVQSILARNTEALGISFSQLGVLEVLHHLGPFNQKELAGKLLRSSANMTTIIDNLEKRELVSRGPDEKDRRATRVELTAKGRELISQIFPLHVQNIYRMMSVLDSSELETLAALCKKLGTGARDKMSI